MSAPFTASQSYFDLRVDYATRRIAISGEFDVATAPNLDTAVAAFQRADDGDITIDLGDVRFIDAAGLGAIASAYSAQAARGVGVVVTGADASVRRLFLIGKLADLLAVDEQQPLDPLDTAPPTEPLPAGAVGLRP